MSTGGMVNFWFWGFCGGMGWGDCRRGDLFGIEEAEAVPRWGVARAGDAGLVFRFAAAEAGVDFRFGWLVPFGLLCQMVDTHSDG